MDVYIASFPYGAGLTLIEAMGAGVPVIMHEHMYSHVLSGLELAYPEAYRWSDPDDLLAHLVSLQPKKLELEKYLSRQQYELFHRPELLLAYLQDSKSTHVLAPEIIARLRPRLDEWAALMEQQISFRRLAYRAAYRCFRSIRASLWFIPR